MASPTRSTVCIVRWSVFVAAALMSDIYEDHKDEDGFLYITYSGEITFGCVPL